MDLPEVQRKMLADLQLIAQDVIAGKVSNLALICGRDTHFVINYSGNNLAGLKAASDQLSKMLLEQIFQPLPKSAP